MIGTSILKLIPEDLYSDEKTIMENIRAGCGVEHFETVRRTKSGQLLDVSLTISPIKDKRGRVIGASKILRDISTRKRVEQALLQAEKIAATGRMAATIAREINNPLEAVMNLMYLLRPMVSDPTGISYFQSTRRNSGASRISPSRRLVITANMQRQALPQSVISFSMQSRSMNHDVQLVALRLGERLIHQGKSCCVAAR
jgi:nitrogen-specific signal transduction histidine kinase